MNTLRCLSRVGLSCLGPLLMCPSLLHAQTFHGLGPTTNTGYVKVSADGGSVAGTRADQDLKELEAFLWTAVGGMQGLGFHPDGGEGSLANDLSADGQVVVGMAGYFEDIQTEDIQNEAFRWTESDGMEVLGFYPIGCCSFAVGVSADGSVVVGYGLVDTTGGITEIEAFRWTEGSGIVGIGDLPGGATSSGSYSVSADGSVIVGVGNSSEGAEAFRWTVESGMVGLGDLPGGTFQSQALAVSADGSVIVGTGRSGEGLEAFRWTVESGMVGLGDLPGGVFESQALGVSADGSVVVGYSRTASGPSPFVWTEDEGMRNLKDVLESEHGLDLPSPGAGGRASQYDRRGGYGYADCKR